MKIAVFFICIAYIKLRMKRRHRRIISCLNEFLFVQVTNVRYLEKEFSLSHECKAVPFIFETYSLQSFFQ